MAGAASASGQRETLTVKLVIYRLKDAPRPKNDGAGRYAQAFFQGVEMAIRLSREERAASSNRGAAKLPPLSPAFVNEADAAYWAHQQSATGATSNTAG